MRRDFGGIFLPPISSFRSTPERQAGIARSKPGFRHILGLPIPPTPQFLLSYCTPPRLRRTLPRPVPLSCRFGKCERFQLASLFEMAPPLRLWHVLTPSPLKATPEGLL